MAERRWKLRGRIGPPMPEGPPIIFDWCGPVLPNGEEIEVMPVADHLADKAAELERLAMQVASGIPTGRSHYERGRRSAAREFASRLRERAAEIRRGEQ